MTEILENKLKEFKCEHCLKVFVRENSFVKHECLKKRRWIDKDKPVNRIAYSAWLYYHQKYHINKKKLDYKDFIANSYYKAFFNFGTYCCDIRVINVGEFVEYLLYNKISVDRWASDKEYTKFLIGYLRSENCIEATRRSVETMISMCESQNIQLGDFFRYINSNKICYYITTGHISPWILYQSVSGKKFLSNLDSSQTNLVFEYIDPARWNIKFKREPLNVEEVKSILKTIDNL